MICCKECLDLLYDYSEGTLPKETSASLEEHFSDCPPCISFLKTYKATTVVSRKSIKANEIPEAVQERLRDFVQNLKKL